MLKILPVALIAVSTAWGQLEPVGLTASQTLRLKVAARSPYTCAAELGFLDSTGKALGPTSHVTLQPGQSTTLDLPSAAVVKQPSQRVEIQPRVVPDPGTSTGACEADAEVVEDKPAGGPHEGIKVHGHWTIDVRNPDGTLASHRDFENSLFPGAPLATNLARTKVLGLWAVALVAISTASNPCSPSPPSFFCSISEPTESIGAWASTNLTVSAPTSGPNSGTLVLNGSVIAAQSGTFNQVITTVDGCPVGVAPAACTVSCSGCTFYEFTSSALNPAINITAGQLIQVTVVISFT